jgi:hypothetical protein
VLAVDVQSGFGNHGLWSIPLWFCPLAGHFQVPIRLPFLSRAEVS